MLSTQFGRPWRYRVLPSLSVSLHSTSVRSLSRSTQTPHSLRFSKLPQTPSNALRLDPPFTPVPGEAAALAQWNASEVHTVLYICRCNGPLFCGRAFAASSAGGQHRNGWPSFTKPICQRALRLRGLLQRAALGGSGALCVTLADRGLAAEGDLVRRQTRGGGWTKQKAHSWREQCVRDGNKRSDPSLLEGCCAECGAAVCRVVSERGGGVKYVCNPSALRAVGATVDAETTHET